MQKTIFREYDLRGIFNDEFNSDDAYTIGRAFASYITDKKVIIGHDNRLSSDEITTKLIEGLKSSGANIIDLGLCTTPMYYAIKKKLGYDNGIMVTASHNPKEYNGFKISFDKMGNAYGKYIYDFRDFVFENNFIDAIGSYQKYATVKEDYLNLINSSINITGKKLKVVFDPGNGTSSIIIKDVLKTIPNLEYVIINGESDGNFPNHHPDPCESKNMIQVGEKVKELGYDLGIALDGDADRVGVVDNDGKLIAVDKLMILIYKKLLPTLKERKAVMDVKCSKAVIDEMQKINLPLTVYRTGASYTNLKVNSEHYDFGGEYSGHLFFTDKWPGFDDGLYAGLRILEILAKDDLSLKEEVELMPKYSTSPEIKIPCDDNKKTAVINKFKEYCHQENIPFNDIDGVRINFKDGFALVRQSNTGPNLTARFEKKDEDTLNKVSKFFLDLIETLKND